MLTSFGTSVTYPSPYSCLLAGGLNNPFWKNEDHNIIHLQKGMRVLLGCAQLVPLMKRLRDDGKVWHRRLKTGILKIASNRIHHWRKLTGEITCENWHSKVSHFHDGNQGIQEEFPASTPHGDVGEGCHISAWALQGQRVFWAWLGYEIFSGASDFCLLSISDEFCMYHASSLTL